MNFVGTFIPSLYLTTLSYLLSYLSQNDGRVHFGLGQDEKIETVEIRWSDGTTEGVSNVAPNKISIVTQSKGVIKTSVFQTR